MACCGKDNEEKETGVRHTSTRAPGTIHEPEFEPRRPTILESITTKPGNRGGGTGNSRPITAPARGATAVDRAASAPRTPARGPRERFRRFGAVPRRARGPRASVVPAVDPTTAQGVNNGGVANRARFSPDSTATTLTNSPTHVSSVSTAHREAQMHRCPLLPHLRRVLGRHVHHRRHRAVQG